MPRELGGLLAKATEADIRPLPPVTHCLGCGRRLRVNDPYPWCASCDAARHEAHTRPEEALAS